MSGYRLTYIVQLHDDVCTDGVLDRNRLFWGKHSGFPGERASKQGAFFSDSGEFAQRYKLKSATILSYEDQQTAHVCISDVGLTVSRLRFQP